jgi:large subunit ribosomal protein L36
MFILFYAPLAIAALRNGLGDMRDRKRGIQRMHGRIVFCGMRRLTLLIQSVRRKGGKSGKGHVYIICSLNPKHKQRQGK